MHRPVGRPYDCGSIMNMNRTYRMSRTSDFPTIGVRRTCFYGQCFCGHVFVDIIFIITVLKTVDFRMSLFII